MNNSLSYPESLQILLDLTSLQLHFAWRWAREHPAETISEVLRNRVDLCRKTDPNPADYDSATRDFSRPAWIALEHQLTAIHAGVHSAEAFELQALACVRSTVEAFAQKTFGSTAKLAEYQCGSLKYDAPDPATPREVSFHIGNAIAPASIFADPTYLQRCLLELMHQAESKYGADSLRTSTWLNSLPKWLELFPSEWHASLGPIQTDVGWHYGYWGQFISAKGTLNCKYAHQLRNTGTFPFYPRKGQCSFAALRRHLALRQASGSTLPLRAGLPNTNDVN